MRKYKITTPDKDARTNNAKNRSQRGVNFKLPVWAVGFIAGICLLAVMALPLAIAWNFSLEWFARLTPIAGGVGITLAMGGATATWKNMDDRVAFMLACLLCAIVWSMAFVAYNLRLDRAGMDVLLDIAIYLVWAGMAARVYFFVNCNKRNA